MFNPEVRPEARDYYERVKLDVALQVVKERIEEWSYDDDPHGYCHERPHLLALVQAAEASE